MNFMGNTRGTCREWNSWLCWEALWYRAHTVRYQYFCLEYLADMTGKKMNCAKHRTPSFFVLRFPRLVLLPSAKQAALPRPRPYMVKDGTPRHDLEMNFNKIAPFGARPNAARAKKKLRPCASPRFSVSARRVDAQSVNAIFPSFGRHYRFEGIWFLVPIFQ